MNERQPSSPRAADPFASGSTGLEPQPGATLERGERALREADVVDRLETTEDHAWWLSLMFVPALAGLGFATWIAFSILGGGGFGAWLITNAVLFLAALQGGRMWKARERKKLEGERASLRALSDGAEREAS